MDADRQTGISRRQLLRGSGVALGLPWLEAFAAADKQRGRAPVPVRMAALYMPNGAFPETWTPTSAERDFELTPSLKPLAKIRKHVTVLSNLWNEQAKDGDGHYVKESSILTCARIKKTQGADLRNGTSFDQVAANALRHKTPLPSLELGVDSRGCRERRCGRLHTGLRVTYLLDDAHHTAGPRTQPAGRLRATLPRRQRFECRDSSHGHFALGWTFCSWTESCGTRSSFDASSEPTTGRG